MMLTMLERAVGISLPLRPFGRSANDSFMQPRLRMVLDARARIAEYATEYISKREPSMHELFQVFRTSFAKRPQTPRAAAKLRKRAESS